MREVFYDPSYDSVGAGCEVVGLPLEQVLADALFKLAGELSLEALKSKE